MRTLPAVRTLLAMGAVGIVVACDSTVPGPTVDSVTISGARSAIHPGETIQLTATVADASGNVLNRAVSWSSSNQAVVAVSPNGVATGIGLGSSTITAKADEKQSGPFALEVRAPGPAKVQISPADPVLQMGDKRTFTAVVLDSTGHPISGSTPQWSSRTPTVVTVDVGGLATAVFVGTASLIATFGQLQDSITAVVRPQPFAVGMPDGTALINPLALQNLSTAANLWIAWPGNQFLARQDSGDYQGIALHPVNLLKRNDASGPYQGWYATTAPVVGTCLSVVQFDQTGHLRWADMSYWSADPHRLARGPHQVYKLDDDGHAPERLSSLVQIYASGDDRYVFFSNYVLPTDQITSPWRLVGGFDDWDYPDGRDIYSQGASGVTFRASGLRRYTNIRTYSSGRDVWALFGHLGDGSISLSPGECSRSDQSGFKDADIHVDGSSAGAWFEAPSQPPEMPDRPPYRLVDLNVGKVWWPVPSSPPANITPGFNAATPWLSIVHDLRAQETSWAEVDYLRLGAVVNGRDTVLASNEYSSSAQPVGGSFGSRSPDWFGTQSYGLQRRVSVANGVLHLPLRTVPDSVWHVWLEDTWSGGYRHLFPAGTQSIWVETRIRLHGPAALEVGWDYYRGTTDLKCDKNGDGHADSTEDGYCEGGKSPWYFQVFANDGWQVVRSTMTGWNATPEALVRTSLRARR